MQNEGGYGNWGPDGNGNVVARQGTKKPENYLGWRSALEPGSSAGCVGIRSRRKRAAPKIIKAPKMASLPDSGTALRMKSISAREIRSLLAK